jgi:hypothetical protein
MITNVVLSLLYIIQTVSTMTAITRATTSFILLADMSPKSLILVIDYLVFE